MTDLKFAFNKEHITLEQLNRAYSEYGMTFYKESDADKYMRKFPRARKYEIINHKHVTNLKWNEIEKAVKVTVAWLVQTIPDPPRKNMWVAK